MLNSGGISSLKAASVFHVSPIDPRIHHPPHVLRYARVLHQKPFQICHHSTLSLTNITLVAYFSLILLQLIFECITAQKRSSIFHRKLSSLCLAEEFDQTQLTHICLQQFQSGCGQFYLAHGLHKVRYYLTLTTWDNYCLLTQIQELGKISPLIQSGTCQCAFPSPSSGSCQVKSFSFPPL